MEVKRDCLDDFFDHPEKIGHEVGFTDMSELHGKWIRKMVFGGKDYTLQAHRGSFKSSCLAVAISILLVYFPERNIIFLRKTDSDVSEMLGMVSKILKSEFFQDLVREMHDGKILTVEAESMNHLSTSLWNSPMGAPQLLGLGIRASITGKHAWYVITDDICNKDDRESRAERERTKRQYDELQNIRNKGGRIINLGTPWHKEDVFSKMPNIERWDCYQTKLISKEQLEALRQSMAPSLFAANYELKHIASSEIIFDTSPRFTDDPKMLRDGVAHVDAAYGGRDYTAFTCGRRDWDNDVMYLYGKLWHKSVDKVIDTIIEESQKLMCEPIKCEDNGDKGFLKKEFLARGAFASTYFERMNKETKICTFLKKWWPKIIFLEGTDPEYIDQILDYTENAEHDDAPDSAASVCRILEHGYH